MSQKTLDTGIFIRYHMNQGRRGIDRDKEMKKLIWMLVVVIMTWSALTQVNVLVDNFRLACERHHQVING